MDQQVSHPVTSIANDDVEPTGVPAVDEVLQLVAHVSDRPVSEHVEVFERAHEQLRRALDAQPEAGSSSDQDA